MFPVRGAIWESVSPGQRPVQILWHSTCYKRSFISISGFFVSFNGRYHVEQRRQWSNMLFYDVFVKDWDQFWVRDVRAFVTCKDAPIGWWVESIKRTAWDAPYSGLPGRNRHRKHSHRNECFSCALMRCECFNNKNRSRRRRSKYYQQGTTI